MPGDQYHARDANLADIFRRREKNRVIKELTEALSEARIIVEIHHNSQPEPEPALEELIDKCDKALKEANRLYFND